MRFVSLDGSQRAVDEQVVADFREAFYGPTLIPGDDGYDAARQIWNGMCDHRPALIAHCTGTADVIDPANFFRMNQNVKPASSS